MIGCVTRFFFCTAAHDSSELTRTHNEIAHTMNTTFLLPNIRVTHNLPITAVRKLVSLAVRKLPSLTARSIFSGSPRSQCAASSTAVRSRSTFDCSAQSRHL